MKIKAMLIIVVSILVLTPLIYAQENNPIIKNTISELILKTYSLLFYTPPIEGANPRLQILNSTLDEVAFIDHNGLIYGSDIFSDNWINATYFIGDGNHLTNLSAYNATYANYAHNESTATFSLYNSTWDNRGLILKRLGIEDFGSAWTANWSAVQGNFGNFNGSDYQSSFVANKTLFVGNMGDMNTTGDTMTGDLIIGNSNFSIKDRVGIGTASPTYDLQVGETTTGVNGYRSIAVFNPNAGASAYSRLTLSNGNSDNEALRLLAIGTGVGTVGGYIQDSGVIIAESNLAGGLNLIARGASASMRFYTGGYTGLRMLIDSTGKVGIGTATPTHTLNVVGNVNVTGYMGVNGAAPISSYGVTTKGSVGGLYSTSANLADTYFIAPYYSDVGDDYAMYAIQGSANYAGYFSGNVLVTKNITSSSTSDIGWRVVDSTDNTACNSICTSGCVHGWAVGFGDSAVNCDDATADKCLCAGAS